MDMEFPQNIEKPKAKIYLPGVRQIIRDDPNMIWGQNELDKISDRGDTKRHSQRIANLGYLMAQFAARLMPVKYNFLDERLGDFVEACLLHDIGKIYSPPELLKKPFALFDKKTDMEKIRPHAQDSHDILKNLPNSPDARVYNTVLLHHEFQENPYPPLPGGLDSFTPEERSNARLLAMLDVFDRCAFGATNNPPLQSKLEIKARLTQQFNGLRNAQLIDFMLEQYETIKELGI